MKTRRVWNKKQLSVWRGGLREKLANWFPIKGKLYQTNTNCDLFKGPDHSEGKIASVSKGSILMFIERDNQEYVVWSKVIVDDLVGWVCLMPEQIVGYEP